MPNVAIDPPSPITLGVVAALDLLAGLCPFNRETPRLGTFLAIVGVISALTTLAAIVEKRVPHLSIHHWNRPGIAEMVLSAPCLMLWMLLHMTIC